MPEALSALVAFVAEHQRCGDLDGGRDSGYVARLLLWGANRAPGYHASPSTGTNRTVASSPSAGAVGGPARVPVGSWRRADSDGGSARAMGAARPPDADRPARRGSAPAD